MNNMASLIAFRIIARSLSAVIIFHNEEYKPKNCGFCVANHTSPIDVCILASDCTFSLVRQSKMFLGMPARYLEGLVGFVSVVYVHEVKLIGEIEKIIG